MKGRGDPSEMQEGDLGQPTHTWLRLLQTDAVTIRQTFGGPNEWNWPHSNSQITRVHTAKKREVPMTEIGSN